MPASGRLTGCSKGLSVSIKALGAGGGGRSGLVARDNRGDHDATSGCGSAITSFKDGREISDGHSALSGQFVENHAIAVSTRRTPISPLPCRRSRKRFPPCKTRSDTVPSASPVANAYVSARVKSCSRASMSRIVRKTFRLCHRKTFRVGLSSGADRFPFMSDLHKRLRDRLKATGKSARAASLAGGLSPDAIGKILKSPSQSQTLETVRKLAVGLDTTPEWLAYGVQQGAVALSDPSIISVDRTILRRAIGFVLEKFGASPEEAGLVVEIFPEALEGPAVDAVDGDPFLSFQVHLQLAGSQRSEHPEPR